MASQATNAGAFQLLGGGTPIVWGSDTIRARLVPSSETPSQDATAMTGLTSIGTDQTLGSKTGPTKDDTLNRVIYDAANPTFPTVAGGSTIGWVVVYKFVTNDAGSTPIAICDVANTPTNGSDIVIDWDADGIFYTQQ